MIEIANILIDFRDQWSNLRSNWGLQEVTWVE
jgi:hypothetical protein